MNGIVTAKSGKTVNLRSVPNGAILKAVPIGTVVEVLEVNDGWSYVQCDTLKGYMMTQYISTGTEAKVPDLTKVRENLQKCLEILDSMR